MLYSSSPSLGILNPFILCYLEPNNQLFNKSPTKPLHLTS